MESLRLNKTFTIASTGTSHSWLNISSILLIIALIFTISSSYAQRDKKSIINVLKGNGAILITSLIKEECIFGKKIMNCLVLKWI